MIFAAIISKSTNLPQLNITCVAKASCIDGGYFFLRAPSGTKYYVWTDIAGDSSADPAPEGFTEIKCDISGATDDNSVAVIVDAAIEAINVAADEFVSSSSSEVVTVNYVAEYEEVNSQFTLAGVGEANPAAGGGFIYLIATGTTIRLNQKNTIIKTADHTIIRINIGKYEMYVSIGEWILFNTDGTSLSAENFNDVMEFLVGHMKTGGYDLYLHFFNLSLGGYRVKFPDGSSTFQNYMTISVKGTTFDVDNSGIWRGDIEIEEG